MSETVLGAATGAWQADGHALKVEYSLAVMAEIRAAANDGFHRLSHGGLEVGGVLFGTHDGNTVRIVDWRPIACRHARGPSFALVAEDEAELSQSLNDYRVVPELAGLFPVGWFHSNTRRSICLAETDVALYDRFFPESWQVALILQPARHGPARAGFFFREAGGLIRRESSYREFEIEAVPARHMAAAGRGIERTDAKNRPPEVATAESEIEPPRFLLTPPPRQPRVWWTLLVVAVCTLAGFGGAWLAHFLFRAPDQPLALYVREVDGQLQVEWERAARVVVEAERGKLIVQDGAAKAEIALDRQSLIRGRMTYARRSEQVRISLVLLKNGSSPVEEIAYYVGQPIDPKTADELVELRSKHHELERENRRLGDDFTREGARADRLQQQYYKLLQERLRETRARGRQAGNQ